MGLIKGLHHVCFKCVDENGYEKVVDFYHNILGLTIERTWEFGIMFNAGNALIEVFKNGEPIDKGIIRHFALETDDVDECVRVLQNAGYEVFQGPKDICIKSTPEYPARIAFCLGPIGEEIEFFQVK